MPVPPWFVEGDFKRSDPRSRCFGRVRTFCAYEPDFTHGHAVDNLFAGGGVLEVLFCPRVAFAAHLAKRSAAHSDFGCCVRLTCGNGLLLIEIDSVSLERGVRIVLGLVFFPVAWEGTAMSKVNVRCLVGGGHHAGRRGGSGQDDKPSLVSAWLARCARTHARTDMPVEVDDVRESGLNQNAFCDSLVKFALFHVASIYQMV